MSELRAPLPTKDPYTDGTPASGRPPMAPSLLWRDVGSYGARVFSGYIREEFLRALQGREAARVYREMRDNSATIGALIFAIEQSLRELSWHAVASGDGPKYEEAVRFADSLRDDMSTSWDEFIVESLSMLTFGYAPMELVYKRRKGRRPPYRGTSAAQQSDDASSKYDDGLIGVRRMPLRGQETVLRWYFDVNGQITGMQQQPWIGPLIDIPIEKLILFRPTHYKNNAEGRSVLRNAYRCFSEDTEILAESGWKLFSELLPKERVATINQVTNALEYQVPTEFYRNWYEGQMFHQGGRWVDQLVTPNHRMYIDRRTGKGFEFIEALDQNRHVWYKRDATWEGEEWETFALPEYRRTQRVRDGSTSYEGERELVWEERSIPMDSWLRFFGYWISDGCTTRNTRGQRYVIISQNPGEVLDDIVRSVEECGFNPIIHKSYDRDCVQVEICNVQLYEYLVQFGKAHDKYVPQELKKLSKRQLTVLFDAMWEGDGGWSGYEVTKTYATVSKKLADDVSEILLKIGHAPIIRWQKGSDGSGCWIVSCVKAIPNGNRVNFSHDDREWLNYSGEVFCVTVPNSTVYVRRNGKASWSGNCYFFSKRIEEEEAVLFERMNGLPVLRVPNWLLENAAAGDGVAAQSLESYKRIVTNTRIHEQMGLILPSDMWPGANGPSHEPMYKFELLTPTGGHLIDPEKVLGRYSLDILKTCMADFIDLGHQARGTQNLAISKVDMFFNAIRGWVEGMAEVLNRYMLSRVWYLNGMDPDTMPQYQTDLAQRIDLNEISNFVLRLSQAGARLFPDTALENYLRQSAGMPELNEPEDQIYSNTPTGIPVPAHRELPDPTGQSTDGPPPSSSEVAKFILDRVVEKRKRDLPPIKVRGSDTPKGNYDTRAFDRPGEDESDDGVSYATVTA